MSNTFTTPTIRHLPKAKRDIILSDLVDINDYLDAPSPEKWAQLPQSTQIDLVALGATPWPKV